MKQFAGITLIAALAFMPSIASAHETQEFEIGGEHYRFVIGSLNEPLVVDDKTGAYLQVTEIAEEGAGSEEDHHSSTGAVAGLEESLKVELIAGDAKKVLDIAPISGEPGGYRAPFYPTVATTLSYRYFGEINGTPVDLTFTCNPAGHAAAKEDATKVEISEGVTRTMKTGSFVCPMEKAPLGFPEESEDIRSLKEGSGTGVMALGVSVAALLVAGYALRRKS